MSSHSLPPEGDPRPAPPRRYRQVQKFEAPIAGLVGLSCREFARLTVTRMDRPLTTVESLRHRLHGSICGICSRFAAQFSALNELTRDIESEKTEAAAPLEASESEAAARVAAAVRAAINKSLGG